MRRPLAVYQMIIPNTWKGKEIDLSYLGLNEVAWRKVDAIELLNYFELNSVFVLGGDVLSLQKGSYKHNYDNWYFEKSMGNFKDSIRKAKHYLENYPDGDFIFVLVIEQKL